LTLPSASYTEQQWPAIHDGSSLDHLTPEQLLLLHRDWLWADSAKQWFSDRYAERERAEHPTARFPTAAVGPWSRSGGENASASVVVISRSLSAVSYVVA
jgi:hypothetical protein